MHQYLWFLYFFWQEAQEEFDEVQEELRKKDAETDSTASELETGQATKSGGNSSLLYTMLSRIFIQAFTMTFLAEWGDRSQLATIILAARENVSAVVIAGILGHAFCTGLAVLGKNEFDFMLESTCYVGTI